MESLINISIFLLVLSLAALGIISVLRLIAWLTRVLGLENYQSPPRQLKNSSYFSDTIIDGGDSGNYHHNSGSDAGDCGDSGDSCDSGGDS
jgi:hypothetical protein